MKLNAIKCAFTVGCLSFWTSAVLANSYTFDTSTGDAAEAIFVTSAGNLQITLKNLQSDPQSVADSLSAFGFSLSGGSSPTLASSSGTERIIAGDGTFTTGSTGASGWVLSGSTSSMLLDVLSGSGHAGPAHTLIGSPGGATYDINGSITGNGPHNPFLFGDLTFNLDITGLTASSVVSSAFFQFGTADGEGRVNGTPKTQSVPDSGTTLALLGPVVIGMHFLRRRMIHL